MRNIAKLKLTQELAINTIVEMNRKYEPDHIMCDEGFGTAQITELRMRGKRQYGKVPIGHPDLNLVNTESICFSSNIEIRDPATNEVLKKRAKPYIVENAVKVLEDGKLALEEEKDYDLIQQMKNYAVAKTTITGNVYQARNKSIGDHDLDAFMIALYCWQANYGEFNKYHPTGHVAAFLSDNPYLKNQRLTTYGSPGIINTTHSVRKSRTQGLTPSRRSRANLRPRKRW